MVDPEYVRMFRLLIVPPSTIIAPGATDRVALAPIKMFRTMPSLVIALVLKIAVSLPSGMPSESVAPPGVTFVQWL